MSVNPVFDITRLPTNTNLPPHNYNFNPVISSPVQQFQQNVSIPLFSFPPPNLPGSQHVFQSGPLFPGTVSPISPANLTPFTSIPPPPIISTTWNHVPFDSNRSSFGNNISIQMPSKNYPNFNNSNFTQPNYNVGTSSPLTNPGYNPRSFTSVTGNRPQSVDSFSNNFRESERNIRQNSVEFMSSPGTESKIWNATSPSPSGYYNTFENTLNKSQVYDFRPSPNSRNFTNAFEKNLKNQTSSNFQSSYRPNSNNFQYPAVDHIKESPSKFRKFNNTIKSGNKLQALKPYTKQNRPDFGTSSAKPNFNHRRANNFQNKNHHSEQGRNFKKNGDHRPEKDKPYSCDTCDRSFLSDAELQYHLSEHIKCNAKNCHFEAHPKIVALHKKMQHDTGYADAINKLKNAEEIEKWRAERRRRFPTSENILKRKAEQAEKEGRGEVIENKEFGKFKRQNGEQTEQRNNWLADRGKRRRQNPKWNNFNRNRLDTASAITVVSDSDSDSDEGSSIKLHKFPGILAAEATTVSEAVVDSNCDTEVVTSTEVNGDLDEPEERTQNVTPNVSLRSTDKLKGKEMSTEFSEELKTTECIQESNTFDCVNINSEDESPVELPINKISSSDSACFPDPFLTNASTENCNNKKDSDDEPPIALPVSKVPLSEVSNSTNVSDKNSTSGSPSVQNDSKFSKRDQDKKPWNIRQNEQKYDNSVHKSGLLEKLLVDDIRHERNVINQCIHHIVKKKFFGIGADA